MSDITYILNDSLYINLTNRCNNSCTFCIKFKSRKFEGRYDLWLTKEPSAEDVTASITEPSSYRQIVFCGYGEPLIRLDALLKAAKDLKDRGAKYIRIDTDGQANLFHGRDITPSFAGLIDEINISLNAQEEDLYEILCRPLFGNKAYSALLDFAAKARTYVPKVVLTAVGLPGVDLEKCAAIASAVGSEFRIRPYYEEKYVS